MAELIGTIASAVTFAALFKSCIDAFEIIKTAQNQEADLRKLVLKLNLEKCRLYTWGEAMGLTGAKKEQPVSATCEFQSVMMETLQMLLQLFEDSDRLQNVYGCKQSLDTSHAEKRATDEVKHLAQSFRNFKLTGIRHSKKSNFWIQARWAINDRKKFASFISDIKDYVDGLQGITKVVTPSSAQEETVIKRVETINDIETLDMLSEVCHEDHPDIARVASDRAETISMTSTENWKTKHWDCANGPTETKRIDLEALTFTELRHHAFRMEEENIQLARKLQRLEKVLTDPQSIFKRSVDAVLTDHRSARKAKFGSEQQPVTESVRRKSGTKESPSIPAPDTSEVAGFRSLVYRKEELPLLESANAPWAVDAITMKADNASPTFDQIKRERLRDLAWTREKKTRIRECHEMQTRENEVQIREKESRIQKLKEMQTRETQLRHKEIKEIKIKEMGIDEWEIRERERIGNGSPVSFRINRPRLTELARFSERGVSIQEMREMKTSDTDIRDAEIKELKIREMKRRKRIVNGVGDGGPSDPAAKALGKASDVSRYMQSETAQPRRLIDQALIQGDTDNTSSNHPRGGGATLLNCFMNLNFPNGGTVTAYPQDECTLLSFNASRSIPIAFLDHFHTVNAKYIAEVGHSKSNILFNRDGVLGLLDVVGIIDAAPIDLGWVEATQKHDFHMKLFVIPVQPLAVCSEPNGWCLRWFFDILAESKQCGECLPVPIRGDSSMCDVRIFPLGKETPIPNFISLIEPDFTPTSDVLLVVMAFMDGTSRMVRQ